MAEHRPIHIDLISDTATRPTDGMRKAIAAAEVGDEQLGEDPSVNALCERAAALLGQEAALFLPSGTMSNHIAIAVHCRQGDEIITSANAHIISSEAAGAAVFSGVFIRGIPCDRGIFSGDAVRAAVRGEKIKDPKSRLVVVEQTNNRGGGAVWTASGIAEVAQAARDCGLALHMDGARLMNAVAATNASASAFGSLCDSVWFDLSKCLGCPVGSVLAGSRDFIARAMVWKHRFGGAMRQAGMLAAAGLYALDHHIDRIGEDHENARLLAEKIADIPGIALEHETIESNLVFFDVSGTGKSPREIMDRLIDQGVRIGMERGTAMRAVTHLGIGRADIDTAAQALKIAVSG